MSAYEIYKNESTIKTLPLRKNINEEIFDDLLAQGYDNLEMEHDKELNKKIKKLYFINKKIYVRDITTGNLIKLNSTKLSWIPNFFIKKICYYLTTGEIIPNYRIYFPSLIYRLKNNLKQIIKQIIR